jgi:hypothetical protein
MTLAQFLQAKPSRYYHRATGYLDPDLRELFRREPRIASRRALHRDYLRADIFLREHKQALLPRVSYWTGVDSTVVFDLLEKCIHRAKALNLWLEREQYERKAIEVTSYLTTICVNYRETGYYMPK